LSALFTGMNQYRAKGGHDREFYLAAYDANTAKIDRKSATPPVIFIPQAFVAITGMIQPGTLASVLRPGDFDSGMAARFLMASPPPQRATWSDGGIREEDMLANISLYWFTGAIGSSFWPYHARLHRPWPFETVDVPVGYCEFPKEILKPPRSLAAKTYTDIRRWTVMKKGGHFAALEEPQALASEIFAFFD